MHSTATHLRIDGRATNGHLTVVVTDNSVDHSSKNGIYVGATAVSATAFIQNVTVAGNRVTSAAVSNGIKIVTFLDAVSNPGTEILSVTDNFVKYTGSDGILVHTTLTGPGTTLTQTSFAILVTMAVVSTALTVPMFRAVSAAAARGMGTVPATARDR